MKDRQFLSVIPKSVKTGALIIVGSTVLIGLVAGLVGRTSDSRVFAHCPTLASFSWLGGSGLGLLAGVVFASWVLCLGYVYADARRRDMPPILWTLIAAFIPNLLGFLLYFVLRRPIVFPCPHCGQAISAQQRFCSSCGRQASSGSSGNTQSGPGLDSTATV